MICFQSDFVLPINADAKAVELVDESLKAAHHYLQPSRLQQFRKYLTTARTSGFNVSEEHTEMIQQDFVDMRKANVKSNADDLHGLLVLSRLLGIARGRIRWTKKHGSWLRSSKQSVASVFNLCRNHLPNCAIKRASLL